MSVSPCSLSSLSFKRHWLASELFVTQHVCDVTCSLNEDTLGAAGQIKMASGEITSGAVGHTG